MRHWTLKTHLTSRVTHIPRWKTTPPWTIHATCTTFPRITPTIVQRHYAIAVCIGTKWFDAFAFTFFVIEHSVRASCWWSLALLGRCRGDECCREQQNEEVRCGHDWLLLWCMMLMLWNNNDVSYLLGGAVNYFSSNLLEEVILRPVLLAPIICRCRLLVSTTVNA